MIVQSLSGTPDFGDGLQNVFKLAESSSSDAWSKSLARGFKTAVVKQHISLCDISDMSSLLSAMERSPDAYLRGLVQRQSERPGYAGLCCIRSVVAL